MSCKGCVHTRSNTILKNREIHVHIHVITCKEVCATYIFFNEKVTLKGDFGSSAVSSKIIQLL